MEKNYLFSAILIIALLCSGSMFGQKVTDQEKPVILQPVEQQKVIDQEKSLGLQLVKKLNTPTKTWIKGRWEIQSNNSKVWKKGHWRFEQKSFEQKSQIYRDKIKPNPRA